MVVKLAELDTVKFMSEMMEFLEGLCVGGEKEEAKVLGFWFEPCLLMLCIEIKTIGRTVSSAFLGLLIVRTRLGTCLESTLHGPAPGDSNRCLRQ